MRGDVNLIFLLWADEKELLNLHNTAYDCCGEGALRSYGRDEGSTWNVH